MKHHAPQSLFTFEQIVVEAEAAKCEAQRVAEQQARDAKIAARVLAQAAREKIKAEEEMAKSQRRREREHKARMKATAEIAQCGINWYSRSLADLGKGSYWTHCKTCGQFLIYTDDPNAKPQACAGRKPQRWQKIFAADALRSSAAQPFCSGPHAGPDPRERASPLDSHPQTPRLGGET